MSEEANPAVDTTIDSTARGEGQQQRPGEAADLEREGDLAADYLEALLDIAQLDGDIDMDVIRDRATVSVVGRRLESLIGPRGEVLDALQELTRLAVTARTGVRSRLILDVGGHRERRRSELVEVARRTAERVVDSGQPQSLDPMTPFERKVIHDAVAGLAGVHSESSGEEPHRRVVIIPG